jgi:hypothetical protein
MTKFCKNKKSFKSGCADELWTHNMELHFFSLALQSPWALAFVFQFHDGRSPWTSDQLVARPLPKHRTLQTQNKHIHTPNIHILCGIRIHDPSFRESEDSTCLTPLGYCDRWSYTLPLQYQKAHLWSNGSPHNALMISSFKVLHAINSVTWQTGACGSVVGWGTMLQPGRSRIQVSMRWNFSSFQPHYGPGVDSPLTEMSTRNLPGG